MPEYSVILSRLQAQCVRREYCRSDIRRKALRYFEGNEAAAQRAVEDLVKERFVDEVRYARAFARDKAAFTGWGAAKIRLALRARGVSEADIAAALEDVDAGAAGERLARLLRTRAASLRGDPQRRPKLLRYGLGRGFSYEEVSAALDALTETD